METPESILAKFDELIADIAADSSRDKLETVEAEREIEPDASKEEQTRAGAGAEAEAEVEVEAEPAGEALTDGELDEKPKPVRSTKAKSEPATVDETPTGPAKSPVSKTAKATVSKPKRKVQAQPVGATALVVTGLTKAFGEKIAVAGIDLAVAPGTIFGIVGPNGAGKTTTLSMVTGLLRPDQGTVLVQGQDVWADPTLAKRHIGVLPDRLRLFDRLTGGQFLYYAGVLRGLPGWTARERMSQLAIALGLDDALGRLVADYSAGMVKKITLAAALIHSPRLLVLDEPFESVDPVSVERILEVLGKFVDAGGTVVLSSHSMDLIQRLCDSVAIIVGGEVLASGTVDEVRGSGSLAEKFLELAGSVTSSEGLEWLHSFSD